MQIKVDIKGLDKVMAKLRPEQVQKATIRALDKTAKQGKVAAQRMIRETYNIKLKDLSSKITTDIHPSRLEAVITAKGGSIQLMKFDPRQSLLMVNKKSGGRFARLGHTKAAYSPGSRGVAAVSVEVRKGQRKVVQRGFIAKMGSGHVGIFKRVGNKRFPIKQTFTIDVHEMFGSNRVMEAVKKRVLEQWQKNIRHELTEGWKHGKK